MEWSGNFNAGADRGGLLTPACGRRVEADQALGQGTGGRLDIVGTPRSGVSDRDDSGGEGSIVCGAGSEKYGEWKKKDARSHSFHRSVRSDVAPQENAYACTAIGVAPENSWYTGNRSGLVPHGADLACTRTFVDPLFSFDVPQGTDLARTRTSCTCTRHSVPCIETGYTRTNPPVHRLRSSWGCIRNPVDGIPEPCVPTEPFVARRNRDLPRLFSFLDRIFPVEAGNSSDVALKSRSSGASTGLSHPKCPKPGFRSTVFK
jgi:hypothetical protein